MKRRYKNGIAVVLSLLMIVSAGSTGTAAVNERRDPIIVVSLGDSYSSGEGIEPFYGQCKPNAEKVLDDNWIAHRSKTSWPSMIEIPTGLVDEAGKEITSGPMSQYFVDVYSNDGSGNKGQPYEWYFVAASGATTENYWKDQIKNVNRYGIEYEAHFYPQSWVFSQIDGTVDYVTLTLGGNDVHFGDVIVSCATGSSYFDVNLGKKTLLDWILEVLYDLDDYLEDIKKTYEAIGAAAPEAYIIVAGYPTLLSEDGYGMLIEKDEARIINMATRLFNAHIKKICHELGDRFRYVDVESSFLGREAYSKNALINPIWIVPSTQDINEFKFGSQYSVHPNISGAMVYADLVNAEIARIEKEKRLSGRQELPTITPVPTTAPTPVPTPPPSHFPQQAELFDETFWSFGFGQTLGSNFDALFHKNGTFTARSYGSGIYDDGTYTYQDGILTINFWFTGSGCVFEGDANGFVSRKKYEMQVGEDYYTISPIPGGSSFYYEPAPTPAPVNNQNEIFDETFWRMYSDGGVTGEFEALFHKNGTFSARCFDDGKYYDGNYSYQNDSLTVEFLSPELNWFNNCQYVFKPDWNGDFETEGTEPGWGYTISSSKTSFFYYPEVLSDGEYYGLLTDWNNALMFIDLLEYRGRHEMSYNYMLEPTGDSYILDITQAAVCLEDAWSEDHIETQYDSIYSALNAEVWDGVTLGEACTMQIRFTVENTKVTKILFLYAA